MIMMMIMMMIMIMIVMMMIEKMILFNGVDQFINRSRFFVGTQFFLCLISKKKKKSLI